MLSHVLSEMRWNTGGEEGVGGDDSYTYALSRERVIKMKMTAVAIQILKTFQN